MADVLELCYTELKGIKTYLIKIGPKRRQGNVLERKLCEAKEIYDKYIDIIKIITDDIKKGNIGQSEKILIDKFCIDFESLYKQILDLCAMSDTSSSEDTKMESFNLKVALSLLPLMTNDNECSLKQLIDNIEYYSSLLAGDECKKKLVQFVLKSRLSQHAKLQLQTDYASVHDLISDMRTVLLPQKSPFAIQNKINQLKQNDLSVQDYGNQLSELFVDLTVSQAEGNLDTYKMIKPLNEKMIIKRFADGLRNRRLSTIISARNYGSMKDAIQGAKDEETSITGSYSGSGEILGMYSSRGRQQHNRGRYVNNNYNRTYYNRGRNNDFSVRRGYYNHRGGQQTYQQSRGAVQRGRGSPWRGRGKSYYRNRSNQGISQPPVEANRHAVNVLTRPENEVLENEFFRE